MGDELVVQQEALAGPSRVLHVRLAVSPTPQGSIPRMWNTHSRYHLSLGVVLLACGACTGSQVSAPVNLRPLPEAVGAIALAPSGGVLADAIGTELFGNGFQVIDTQQMSNYLVRLNLDELELSQPRSLTLLRDRGIQAVMSVRAVGGYDEKPQSATVRVVSTQNGEVIAALNWQNGHGGVRGSPADDMMRKDVVGAAREIAEGLVPQLRRK